MTGTAVPGLPAVTAGTAPLPPAQPVIGIATGLWMSQTLLAALDVDLFTFLSAAGGASVAGVARGTGIEPRPAGILLTACTAMGLLYRDGDRYRNAPEAEHYLVQGRPYHLGDYVRMLREYAAPGWLRATEAVRSNSPSKPIPRREQNMFEAGNRPDFFWNGLYAYSALTARALAPVLDLGGARRLLDVGGGAAAFDVELCRHYPELRATVYDLPHVCEIAAARARESGLADRIETRPGDFFGDDELPCGHDVVLLSMILHDWDEPTNRTLLAKCFRALEPGGHVVVTELFVDDDRNGPLDAALMSMNMLVGTWGRNYTAGECGIWLREAGFTDPRLVPFRGPAANGALIARRP